MTREELRKKRKEIAESNGYQGYVPKTRAEGTRGTVGNPEPVQESKSTWDRIQSRIPTVSKSTAGQLLRKEYEIGSNVVKRFTNPTQYVAEEINKTARNGLRTIKEGKTDIFRGWVDKGAFSDGYQYGDITRSAIGTTGDIAKQAFKGAIAQPGEALGDLMSIAQAGYNEYIKGDKKRAEAILRKASEDHSDDIASGALGAIGTAYKYLGKGQKAQLLLEIGQAVAKGGNVGQNLRDSVMNTFRQKYGYYKNVGEESLLGEAGENTISSMATNARQRFLQDQLGLTWQSQMFAESMPETYLQKRIKEGLTPGQSVASSLADFGIEWFTEEMFDGIKLKGTGNTTINKFLDANINKLQDNFERTTLKYLKGVYGEATEEVVGAYMSALSDYLIKHFENKDWTMEDIAQAIKDVTMDPNTWKGAISAGLSVGGQTAYTLGGDVRGIYRNEQRNQAIIESSLSQEDKQTLIDSMEYEAPEKPNKKEIKKQEEMKSEVDEILNKLDGEEKKKVQSALEQRDISTTIQESELDENQKNTLSNIAQKYQLTLDEIQTAIEKTKNGEYALDELTRTQNKEISEQEQQITQAEGKTSQNETSNEIGLNLRKSIDAYNNSRQEGQKIFDINDEDTRKEIDAIQKVAEKRGLNVTFDESRFNNNNINAFYEYDDDGNVAGIVLNPNTATKKYVQNLVVHEMTHSFEGSKEYEKLSKAVLNYAKSKGEYKNAIQDLKNTYAGAYSGEKLNKVVEKEAVANILGEKLGSKEFINDLVNGTYSQENRNFVQKIYDFVKEQINRFKGYKDQEAYWNNVKKLFDEAYNKSEISRGQEEYSIDTSNNINYNTTKGDVEYEKRFESDVGRHLQELLSIYNRGETDEKGNNGSIQEKERTEKNAEEEIIKTTIEFAKKYPKENLTKNEKELQRLYKALGGKLTFFEVGGENFARGLSDTTDVYIDAKAIEEIADATEDNVAYHELAHFLRQNKNDEYMKNIQPITDKLANDEDFRYVLVNFAKTKPDITSDYFDEKHIYNLAEDIVGDTISSLYTGYDKTYDLPESDVKTIKDTMDKILGESGHLNKSEDSSKSLFSLDKIQKEKNNLEDTTNDTEENEWQRKVNRSMTMEQARDMVQRAFVTGKIEDWFDGQYKNGDEWLEGEGASEVALIIDNDYNLQNKYVNANEDILNEEYTIDDVIEAYQNGTLVGSNDKQTQRLDTSKSTGYKDNSFYAPKEINADTELYSKASQRVTNKNRKEVYKARADFILNAHNEGYIESLGLTQKEVNEKLRSWTAYPKNAMETSMSINKGVAKENRWTGIENCAIVNELSVTPEQLDSMVKEVKGASNDYQRRYISNTMLAIDTHMNFKNLTFDFAPDVDTMNKSALGDYNADEDIIRVKRDGQNTVSHEMTHYLDHLMGRELANGYNLGLTRLCRSNLNNWENGVTFTTEQKQFINNFANFLEDIENSADIGSSYKMDSQEVFARFGARFTEWTRNLATGNRYGYEAEWYKDNFTTSQYKEFARLLQEYSLLKTTNQANGRSVTLRNLESEKPDVKYSLDTEDLKTDNQGNKINKGMQEYLKGISSEELVDGKVPLVFHTTTDKTIQFNEFNPVGTPYYRFGDQVVNYFTDSKDMSGSYANNEYEMADTKIIQSQEDLDNFLNEISSEPFSKAIYRVEEKDGKYEFWVGADTIDGEKKVRSIKTFDSIKDLYKNIKDVFRNDRGTKKKLQYQGYVKLTNPYVIDAEGKNWDAVKAEIEKGLEDEYNKIRSDKEKAQALINLQIESESKYNKYIEDGEKNNYRLVEQLVKDIGRGKSADANSTLFDAFSFGFDYNEYADKLKEVYSDVLDGNKTVREYLEEYGEKHNITDIRDWADKVNTYGDMTLNDFLKKANELYEKDLKVGRPESHFIRNYHKILGKRYDSVTGMTPEKLYKLAEGVFSKVTAWDVLGERLTTNDIVKQVIEMNKNGAGYDGVIMKNVLDYGGDSKTEAPANLYVTFASNQFKAQDNENPTNDPDIRYSQDVTGAWNNFMEKYFKTEGTGTTIQDMKKLPQRVYTPKDFEDVLNSAKNIPQDSKEAMRVDFEGKTLTKEMFEDWKKTVKQADEGFKEMNSEQQEQRFNSRNYQDKDRKSLIAQKIKEFNMSMEYDDSEVTELDEIIPRNRNGKRTVAQWKNFAKQLGQRIANMSPEQIEDIAVKSYLDLQPTKAITRYDSQTKTNNSFEQLYPNDWVNSVYEGVRENRQFSMETENQAEKTKQATPKMPKQAQILPAEQAETIDEDLQAIKDNSLLNKEKNGKSRKHYKTYSQTDTLSIKDRNQAKELFRDEVYVPVSNNKTIENANRRIKNFEGGIDSLYKDYNYRIAQGEEMSLTDIATMERMIQLYSEKQDHSKVNELMQNVAILGTELGQKVQALSIIKRATPEGQLRTLQRLIQRVNTRENTGLELTDEQVQRILDTNNPKETEKVITEIAEELGKTTYAKFGDRARAWRYLSMLGNIRTHIRNITGNVTMDLVQQLKNKVAGIEQDIASVFKPSLERTATFKFANKEQKKFAKKDAKRMKGAIDNNGVIDVEKIFERSKRTSRSKIINAIETFNSNLLEAEDDMFLTIAYKQAMQGYMSANNLTAKDMEDTKTLGKAREYAIQQAKEATFHQFSNLARQLNAIEKLGDATGLMTSGIVPFKKTPINVAKTGVAYSPLGIARAIGGTIKDITTSKSKLDTQLKNGDLTQEEHKTAVSNMVNNRIDQMAKGLTGTAIAILGYGLAQSGIISGADDDEEEEFDTKLGKQELAVRIGDNTYSLDWLAPTAIPLFVGANIATTVYDAENESALNATLTALANIVSPMTEMSMLQGLASALSSYEQESANKLGDILTSALTSYAGQYVPTALGQVAKTIDPTVRDTYSTKKGIEGKIDRFKNQQIAKLPGLSQSLPAKTNVWGEEKKRADNPIQRFLETAVLPYNREKVIEDMTSEELKNVFRATDEASTLPQNPQKSISINKEKYNLTSQEYNQAKKTYGENSKKLLDTLVKTSDYKKLESEDKYNMIKKIYAYSKEKIKSDYAKKHGINFESNSTDGKDIFNSIQAVEKAGGKAEDYIKYLVGSQKYTEKAERIDYLNSLPLKDSVKNAIYANDIATYTFVKSGEDENYNAIQAIAGKVSNDYTKYIQKSSENAFVADKDKNGNSIKGSKQKKFEQFMKESKLTPMEKLYITVKEGYAKNLSQQQRNTLRQALENNKDSINEDTYNSFIKKLDEADKKKK